MRMRILGTAAALAVLAVAALVTQIDAQSLWRASGVVFTDTETLQGKFDADDLGGATESASGVTYPKADTDNLAWCGTDSSAPLYFDCTTGQLAVSGTAPGYDVAAHPTLAQWWELKEAADVASPGNRYRWTLEDADIVDLDVDVSSAGFLSGDISMAPQPGTVCAGVYVWENGATQRGNVARMSTLIDTEALNSAETTTIVGVFETTVGNRYLEFYTATCSGAVFPSDLSVRNQVSRLRLERVDIADSIYVASPSYGSTNYSDQCTGAGAPWSCCTGVGAGPSCGSETYDQLIPFQNGAEYGVGGDFTLTTSDALANDVANARIILVDAGVYAFTVTLGLTFDRTK